MTLENRLMSHIDRGNCFPSHAFDGLCFLECGQPSVKILYKYESRQDAYDREDLSRLMRGRRYIRQACNLSAGHGHKIVKYDSGYVLLGSAEAVDVLKRP